MIFTTFGELQITNEALRRFVEDTDSLSQLIVQRAMMDIAVALAIELGYSATEDAAPNDGDLARALRERVSVAAVLHDLCWQLRIDPPPAVLQALDGEEVLVA